MLTCFRAPPGSRSYNPGPYLVLVVPAVLCGRCLVVPFRSCFPASFWIPGLARLPALPKAGRWVWWCLSGATSPGNTFFLVVSSAPQLALTFEPRDPIFGDARSVDATESGFLSLPFRLFELRPFFLLFRAFVLLLSHALSL